MRVAPPASKLRWPWIAALAAGSAAGFLGMLAWLRSRAEAPLSAPPPRAEPVPAPRAAERRALVSDELHASPAADPERAAHLGAVELNNQATDDLTRGAILEAVGKFERCLAVEPTNAVFAGNLAEALIRLARAEHERGELDPAIEHLARAIELVPAREDREALERVLERWKRERELGADDWSEESSRFELSFDTDRGDLLHHSHEVLEHLERSYDDLVLWFGRDPLAGRPAVRVVFYDPEDFDRLTGLGDWAGGVFDGVVRVSARDLTEGTAWRATLVHELVHAFLEAWCGGGVPGWLNEGLAQKLEGKNGTPNLLGALIEHGVFPLDRLAGSLAGWSDAREIGLAYVQSLAFVQYLSATYGDEALRRMLDGVARGEGVEPAFAAFTRVELALAFEDWRAALGR